MWGPILSTKDASRRKTGKASSTWRQGQALWGENVEQESCKSWESGEAVVLFQVEEGFSQEMIFDQGPVQKWDWRCELCIYEEIYITDKEKKHSKAPRMKMVGKFKMWQIVGWRRWVITKVVENVKKIDIDWIFVVNQNFF